MTIEQAYNEFTGKLKRIYEEREAANIADWVFENVTGIKKLQRITDKQNLLNNSTHEQLNCKLHELLQHRPVQYVMREAWFHKMKLKVNEHVLIPRPETEELVEWIIEDRNNVRCRSDIVEIIDIGTGSGCIAIALKKELPGSDITAIDVSQNALAVAQENAKNENVEINFLNVDFLNENSRRHLKTFDVIVSNPPYIPKEEKLRLAKNVTDYEPHIALFTEDDNPLIFYTNITAFAASHLKKNGKIFVEIHENYADKVKEIFSKADFSSEIKMDLHGKLRMICASK